jgi:hypothetical protein
MKKVSPDTTEKRRRTVANVLSKSGSKTRIGKTRLLTLDSLDFRTAAYNDARQLIETLQNDRGGETNLSEGERQLITRIAMTGAIVADFETRWVSGQQIPLADYLQACRTQCRLLALLGLSRRSKDITPPNVDAYAEHINEAAE